MKKVLFIVLTAVMLLTAIPGCRVDQPVLGQVIQSDKSRDTGPVVSAGDLATLVEGNNQFAFNLYQVLRQQEDGNLFYSPYSISAALAMTWAGAKTETAASMANALSFLLAQDKLHAGFNSLDLLLQSRSEGAQGQDDEGFRLNIANAIWGQQGYNFLPDFLDVLAQNYGAGMRIVDFVNRTEESRIKINDWVSEKTEGKIKDLIPQGSIDTMTRLVLTNAIYFNAAWLHQFEKTVTANGIFHTLHSGDVTVPMMHQTDYFKYADGANYQAVELPYDGQELSMVILLPGAGEYEAFEQSLTADGVNAVLTAMKKESVILTMPKFSFDSSLGLKDALTQLGMGVAFTESADFSGMNGKKDLLIQDVLHKAFVSVDEKGTEAAAATAVIVGTTSLPINQKTVIMDRPFIFFIRDIQTNSIIFIGRVLNPAA